MMVAVLLGALSLGACVDDNESASVTNIRDAKAQQLLALAEKAKLEGEAAKIAAEAEKAMADAKAAYLNEKTEEARQKFLVQIEKIKAEAEAAIKKAQMDAQYYEQQLLKNASLYVQNAYDVYKTAADELYRLRQDKTDANYTLAKLQAGSQNLQAFIDAETARLNNEIAKENAKKDAWNSYQGNDKSELEAQKMTLLQDKTNAKANQKSAKANVTSTQQAAVRALEIYDAKQEEKSSIKAVAAVQDYWKAIGNSHGIYIDGVFYTPILEKKADVSEELPINDVVAKAAVYYYTTNSLKTVMNQYYSNKVGLEDYLGHEGSETQLATGLYKWLADAEEAAAASKKAYDDAAAEYTKLESTVAGAEKAIKTAEAAVKAAEADVTAKKKAQTAAQDVVDKLPADASDVERAQAELALAEAKAALNLAIATRDKAQADLNKLKSDNADALNKYYELESKLPGLQVAAEDDAVQVAYYKDAIANTKKQIEDFDENAALWNAALTAIESDEYAKVVEEMKSNKDVATYVAAVAAYNDATDVVESINDELTVIGQLIKGAYDVEEEIAKVEKEIAKLQYQLDRLAYENFEVDSEGEVKESQANLAKLIAQQEERIAYLDEKIAYQEQIVEIFKASLEEAINNDNGEEETPAA